MLHASRAACPASSFLRGRLASADARSAVWRYRVAITVALLNLWIPLVGEVAFIVAVWCAVALVSVVFGVLGAPFYRLSDALTPHVLDALRNGQERRRNRFEAAQRALRRAGEVAVGFTFLGALAATVVALWGVRPLVIGVGVLLGLGLLTKIAERIGLVDPSF